MKKDKLLECFVYASVKTARSLSSAFYKNIIKQGLDEGYVADRLDINKKQVRRYFKLKNPTIKTLSKIAWGMNCVIEIKFTPLDEIQSPQGAPYNLDKLEKEAEDNDKS